MNQPLNWQTSRHSAGISIRRLPSALALAGLLAVLGLVLAPLLTAVPAGGQVESPPLYRRVTLFEFYTAVWCSSCYYGDLALEELKGEYGAELAVLEYHPGWWEGEGPPDKWASNGNGWTLDDPFGTREIDARYDFYWPDRAAFGFPSVAVNGDTANLIERIGTAQFGGKWYGDVPQTRQIYQERIEAYSDTTPYGLELAPLDISGLNLTLAVTARLPDLIPANLTLNLVIFENDVFWWGWNGDGTPSASTNTLQYHQMVARDLLEPVAVNSTGATLQYTTTAALNATWQQDRLGVVAYLRNEQTKEVVQAAVLDPAGGFHSDPLPEVTLTTPGPGLILGGGAVALTAMISGLRRRRHG